MSIDINSSQTLDIKLALTAGSEMSPQAATVYFGYGSNLWQDQMRQRCPTSTYIGIARLKGYEWFIYDRGYANIKTAEDKTTEYKHDYTQEVWGLVYQLEPEDEEDLDMNEGVPIAYTKELLGCELWEAKHGDKPDRSKDPKQVDMLVYINRKLTTPSKSRTEYVYRMNKGIKDALKEGMPEEYVKQVMRKFIPEVEDSSVAELARKQALKFED
ncbi:unnamed protein product [Zymoseptoria tritici ST99CH_1E4]|uniref:gamma-glutamylcyclotransferase n=1 Tax=Zymoseptoria tritici ST99CH_1E4 TaxID=1276532 RepID=A0A2H1GHA9_ZYMTR|nr:unnamed protein product [Zymoseptoria tritici ST99CH_1E4]